MSRICLGCMGFGDPTIGQHSWTIGEEPTHNLSGVMAVNKPTMSEEPVWVAASKNK